MTENPTNDNRVEIGDDNLLGIALRGEVPPRGTSYWSSIDKRLATPRVLEGASETTAPESVPDISAGTRDDAGVLSRLRTWPVLAAAAALVVIAGLLAVRLLPSNGERVDAGFADGDNPAALEDLPGPTQNVDHWHAVYGVWDCTANDGNGAWLPAFQSTEDDVGIHSHQAGLIYIHPFFEESAGRNATFSHFADSMNFTITDDAVTLEDGSVLAEGAMCNGEPAVLEMYRWQDARALEADPTLPPRTITAGFGAERFYNDLEVWAVALTPAGSAVPLPPQDHFDELASWWFQSEKATQLSWSTPDVASGQFSFPPFDSYVRVSLVGSGTDVDPVIEAQLALRPPELPGVGAPEKGSGRHWLAIAAEVRLEVELVTYLLLDDSSTLTPTLSCYEVIEWGGGCGRSDDPIEGFTRLRSNTGGDIETVTLLRAPDGARWLSLQLDDGHQVIADVVEDVSWAAWRVDRGGWTTAELLDVDHNVLWSDTN